MISESAARKIIHGSAIGTPLLMVQFHKFILIVQLH